MMKPYSAPSITVENVLPDTAVSSTPSYCVACEDIAGKTQIKDRKASDYGASTDQYVIIGDTYFTCVAIDVPW